MNFQSSQSTDSTAVAPGTTTSRTDAPSGWNASVPKPFLTVMAVAAVLAALYYWLIAAPMYVSQASFTIHSQQATATPMSLLAGLGGATTDVGDIVAVQEHIQSHEMLNDLDKQHHLREAYTRFRPDFFRRLSPNASDEDFLSFYKHMVSVKLDREAHIIEVDVRAFDAKSASSIAESLLKRTEEFVDGMTQRVRTESLQNAQTELERAEADAKRARDAVANFRGSSHAVDPAAAGAQVQGTEAALESAAAQAQAELAAALTFNQADSPTVRQIQARIDAIRGQAAKQKARQSGAAGTGIPGQVTSYETLQLLRTAAETKLAGARTAYEAARVQAVQREKYVVRVINPSTPDRPAEPKRMLDFLMVMIFTMTGYAIVSLAVAGIRDHRGV